MNAIILAAGHGKRLRPFSDQHPKSLLEFDGDTLLARHLRLLDAAGMSEIWVVAGHLASQIEAALAAIPTAAPVHLVHNQRYHLGNALSLLHAAEALSGGPSIAMDADLLYDPEIIERLLACEWPDSLLVDPQLSDSGEEVKVALNAEGWVTEVAKKIEGGGRIAGESLGIFRFGESAGRCLAERLPAMIEADPQLETENAVTRLAQDFHIAPVSVAGLPWIEIDFWDDVTRANNEILPRLSGAPSAQRTTMTKPPSRN